VIEPFDISIGTGRLMEKRPSKILHISKENFPCFFVTILDSNPSINAAMTIFRPTSEIY